MNQSIAKIVEANPRFRPIRRGRRESHNVESLAQRLFCSSEAARLLVARGVLKPKEFIGGRRDVLSFSSDELNDVAREVAFSVVRRAVEFGGGEVAAATALDRHVQLFSTKPSGKVVEFAYPRRDDEPTVADRAVNAAGTAAKVAGAFGAASFVRGRLALGAKRADALGRTGTTLIGARRNGRDIGRAAAAVTGAASDGLEVLRRALAARRNRAV